jgi:23S rRNA pseudoU1915 N3-methylase RlmH
MLQLHNDCVQRIFSNNRRKKDMKKHVHTWLKKALALTLVLAMAAGFAGCKTTEELPPEAEDRTVVYFAASYVTAQVQDAYKELIKVYNETQGVKDGVFVQMRDSSGPLSGLESALRNNYQYDVIQLRDDEYVILLDLAGKTCDSVGLAEKIQDLYNHSKSRIAFVIGGSLGVSDALIRRADMRWKLSDNTLPHQLCRIIVLEQIYRSFRILHHEPYHK